MPLLRRPIAVLVMVLGLWGSPVSVSVAQDPEPAEDDKLITMDFQDVDLGVLVKFISEITHKNFIVDEKVKGKVTVISPAKITVDEAYLVFQSVLQVKGFTTVPSGTVIKILSTKEAKSATLRTIVPKGVVSPSDEYITRLVPLTHVDANNMVSILQPMVSPDGLLAAYSATNTLILIDTAANTARLVRILAELDVEGFERAIDVIRLNYVFSTEIAATLAQVLDEGESPQQPRAPAAPQAGRPPRAGAPAGQAAVAGGTTPARSFKIIPDERTNTLIVLAGPLEMRRIKELIQRLDVPLPLGTGRIHVYYLKYANSYEMVATLNDLIGGGGAGGLGAGLRARGVMGSAGGRSGGLGQRGGSVGGGGFGGGIGGGGFGGGIGGGGFGGGMMGGGFGGGSQGGSLTGGRAGARTGLTGGTGFGGAPGGGMGMGGGGAGGVGAEGDIIRITADPSTNALIINASPQDYETIKEVIEKLDVRRRQVYVEAIILEVRLSKARTLGFDFQGGMGLGNGVGLGRSNLSGNLNSLLSSPSSLGGLVLAAASNQTVRLPDGSTVPAQVALFTALQNDSDVNILSTPNLLTTDNQEAEIVVGQNIPFVASRSTSEINLTNQFNTIERRDVGITLRITPQISEGGTVRLDLFQEVSAVVSSASDAQAIALGPTTTIRSATTTVVARDNQTVAIGGLISDDIDNSRSQIPFVSDIPVLGNLLRSTSTKREKINLLIFLTPHIVRTEADSRRLSLDQRDRLKAFLQEQGFPNLRSDVLDMPSWETLPPPAEGGEKDAHSPGRHSSAGSQPIESSAAPARYVLLASFWEQGHAPPGLAAANGLVAIVLPEDSELHALFARGKNVRFASDSYSALFHCLDTFSSQEEAQIVYPEGLRVSGEPHELLHWREISGDASARNTRSWTKVN